MPHIRLFRHYIHTPYLMLSVAEGLIICGCTFLGYYSRFGEFPPFQTYLIPASALAATLVASMIAMGVYESRVREGMTGMSLRTAVAIFLLGTAGIAILTFVFPMIEIGRGVLLFATVESFIAISLFRLVVFNVIDEAAFKTRVVILGTGQRALKIASRMRRRADQRAFTLHGFLDPNNSGGNTLIEEHGASILRTELTLAEYCEAHDIDELVVAMDERRRNQDAVGGLPLDELLECRLRGIQVCDVQQFIEREASKVDVDLLRPSWMVFSDGFISSPWRQATKRTFDLFASGFLLLIAWPFMLIAAIFIRLEDGGPILYRQSRIGLDGRPFDVIKFRSMGINAETAGEAVWASQNDPRVTRIGAIIRKTRIDELPQLFNVFRGDMSFVGPRPERPMFVDQLKEKIPFYDQRHRVKPGITGWAQLCYPYGASVEDAKEKLQYDLYYLKNHSLLLDMIILLQTVEVVLVGEGAR